MYGQFLAFESWMGRDLRLNLACKRTKYEIFIDLTSSGLRLVVTTLLPSVTLQRHIINVNYTLMCKNSAQEVSKAQCHNCMSKRASIVIARSTCFQSKPIV